MKKRGACKLEPDPAVEQVERGDARKRTAEAHERPFQQKGHANVMGGRAHQPEQLQFPHAGEHGEPDAVGHHEGRGHDQQDARKRDNDAHELDEGVEMVYPLPAVLHLLHAVQVFQIVGEALDLGQTVERALRIHFNGRRQKVIGHAAQHVAVTAQLL